MRDRERIVTLRPPRIHPLPEVFGIDAIKDGEKPGGRLIFKEYIAVQIAAAKRLAGVITGRHRRIFIGGKGRQYARFIMFVGGTDNPPPCVINQLAVIDFVERLAGPHGGSDLLKRVRNDDGIGAEQSLSNLQFRQGIVGVIERRNDSHISAVIGRRREIERRAVEPHLKPAGMCQRLALGKIIDIIQRRADIENIGVKTVLRMDVGFAEINVARGIRRGTGG